MANDNEIRLTRLEELKGFQVAEGDHDIRGWEVRTPDDRKIGKVEELIVDPAERRVRYIEVKVDRKALGFDEDRHILVPIGAARIPASTRRCTGVGQTGVGERHDREAAGAGTCGSTALHARTDHTRL